MSDPASKLFLTKRVNPILEKLVIELVVKKPENIVTLFINFKTEFMISWLQEKGGNSINYNL